MDCRLSLVLGLGLLTSVGCKSLPLMTSSEPKKDTTSPATTPIDWSAVKADKITKEKVGPKRNPKPDTCIAFGDFRVREAKAKGHSEAEARRYREEARKAYGQALSLNPKAVVAQIGIARSYLDDDDYPNASAAYQEALKLAPNDASLWHEFGMAHSRHKQWQPAVDALSRSTELAPDNRSYGNALGYTLARAGAYDQSLIVFSRLVGEPRAHYNVARMMVHMQHNNLAKQQLQLALSKDPQLADAKALMARIDQPAAPSDPGVVPVEHRQPAAPQP